MTRIDAFRDAALRRVEAGFYDTDHAVKPTGGFASAIAGGIIAEIKPRSPSEGRLVAGDPGKLIPAYLEGGAAAISVLTDGDHFDGHPDLLAEASKAGIPTLMKDFIVSEAQLDCAARCGASAVLLIERMFEDPAERERMVKAAHGRSLQVLLEVHNQADWQRASTSSADLIGVNARDLETLEVDTATSHKLLAQIALKRPVVALSGLTSPAQARASLATAHAVLIGSSLVKSPQPSLWLKAMRRPLAKVCGITNAADLEAALDAGADMVGFVVDANSPRHVSPMVAHSLVETARGRAATVLVTAHADAWEVREWCRVAKPDWVQIHGFTSDQDWRHSLANQGTYTLHAGRAPEGADGIVIDNPTPGSGQTLAWDEVAADLPGGFTLLAGGLDGTNAREALASGVWGLDASSRLESTPGLKDHDKVRAFVHATHGGP